MLRCKKYRMKPDLSFEIRPRKPKRAKGFLCTQKYIPDDRADPPEEPLIKLVPREEWGATPPKDTAPMTIPASHVRYNQTHTDACTLKEDCIALLQKIQKEHMEVKGLNDIQYHFMIGGDGTVYEGRGWKTKGENHPGIDKKEYFDVAYIGNYAKNEVPVRALFAIYDLLGEMENANIVTVPYVFFNDLKELEKTPDDLLTHEDFGHVSKWDVTEDHGLAYNTTPKANKDILWSAEEKARGHETGEMKLTPEEIEYLFADKKFMTEEESKARIDQWAEKHRSYYEPHFADVLLQECKDEYEKARGVKYDDDNSEWALTRINPPPPPRVYRDPKEVHGEESIITQMENLMRPGAHRFDKYGKEIPIAKKKKTVSEEKVESDNGLDSGRRNPRVSRDKTKQGSNKKPPKKYKKRNKKIVSEQGGVPSVDEYKDGYFTNSFDGGVGKTTKLNNRINVNINKINKPKYKRNKNGNYDIDLETNVNHSFLNKSIPPPLQYSRPKSRKTQAHKKNKRPIIYNAEEEVDKGLISQIKNEKNNVRNMGSFSIKPEYSKSYRTGLNGNVTDKPKYKGNTALNTKQDIDEGNKKHRVFRNGNIPASLSPTESQAYEKIVKPDSYVREEVHKSLNDEIIKEQNNINEKVKCKGNYTHITKGKNFLSSSAKRRIQLMKEKLIAEKKSTQE